MFKSKFLFSFLFVLITAVAVIGCCDDDEDDTPVDDTCADLIVQPLDINNLNVSCPGGGGTCVTTLTFTIENTGTADASAFNISLTFDPSGSVMVSQAVPGGLAAGSSLTLTVMTPPGGNCYDPDCSITVTVDSGNAVEECDEGNNQASETFLG